MYAAAPHTDYWKRQSATASPEGLSGNESPHCQLGSSRGMLKRCLGKPHRTEEQTLGVHAQRVQRPPASQVRGPGELVSWKPPAGNGLLSSYSWASSTPRPPLVPLVLGTLSHYQPQVRSQVPIAQTLTHICTRLCCFLRLPPIPSPLS